VTNAALNCVGNRPDESDLLNSSVMNGANTSALSFRRRMGSGSVAHCLSGSLRITAVTSSTVRTQNAEKSQPDGADTKRGGGASAVELRTPAIFSSKKRCNSCASIDVDGGTRPRPMVSYRDIAVRLTFRTTRLKVNTDSPRDNRKFD